MDAFQKKFTIQLSEGEANTGSFGVVPEGKTAVIEHVSLIASGTGALKADYFITSTVAGPDEFTDVPVMSMVGFSGAFALASHPVRAYAAAGTQFGGVVRRFDTTGRVDANIVLTGYYSTE